jgi:AAA+ ATPase superfamily predicted ATPase
MRLKPMDFWSSKLFLEAQEPAAQVEFFACFGGTPAYLEKIDPRASLKVNIQELVLDQVAYLYDEPRLLLTQELREPRNYFAIMASVAAGNTRLNDIVQDCGLDRGLVSRYLDTLIGLELVEREVPVTEKDPSRSRRGLYGLADPYFRFWFRFVLPNLSDLMLLDNRESIYMRYVSAELDHFVSPVFERLCRDWIRRRVAAGHFGLKSPRIGRWWDGHSDIDLVAYDENTVLMGECKWSRHPVGPSILRTLESRQVAGLEGRQRFNLLFSRSGFQGLESNESLLLVDLSALIEDRMPDSRGPLQG